MKKFLLNCLLLICSVIFIVVSNFILCFMCADDTELDAIPWKHQQIAQIKGEKIVFIGGSSLAFGLDSEKISKHFSFPVFNMGVMAALGLNYMLGEVEPFLSKGDYLIVTPEYKHFYSEQVFYGKGELVYVLLKYYPNKIIKLSGKQFNYFFLNALDKMARYIVNFPFCYINAKKPIYHSVNSYNIYGDCDKHWNIKLDKLPKPFVLRKDRTSCDDAIKAVLSFKNRLNTKGINVIILPPPLQKTSYENLYPAIKNVKDALILNKLGSEYNTERYCFDDEMFFDTAYHCTKEGVDKRTQLVIEDLEKFIPIKSK